MRVAALSLIAVALWAGANAQAQFPFFAQHKHAKSNGSIYNGARDFGPRISTRALNRSYGQFAFASRDPRRHSWIGT
jgi:glycerol uptake facilitator-like aquaporin